MLIGPGGTVAALRGFDWSRRHFGRYAQGLIGRIAGAIYRAFIGLGGMLTIVYGVLIAACGKFVGMHRVLLGPGALWQLFTGC